MKNIDYKIGNVDICNKPLTPFNEDVCKFLNEFSTRIFKSPIMREFKDLSALAFWTRKANIQSIKKNYNIDNNRLGRGLCFHITPSNVPVNAFFSYFFSLLAGNSNIVRLTGKDFPQVEYAIEIIKDLLDSYPEIKKRTAFIKYEHSSEINEYFSAISDARLIWGGDKTISIFKELKTQPKCVDITFPDRYSICIIDAKEIGALTNENLLKLAEAFYNDTYLMDQNACSSPQLVCWVNYDEQCVNRFWEFVYDVAYEKYNLQDSTCVDKYTKFCEDSIKYDNIKKISRMSNLLYRTMLSELNDIENFRGYCGYFYEYSLDNFNSLYDVINEKFQTITYYGIDTSFILNGIIVNNIRGVDRIVPIGKALDINVFWDGHDLIRELSREIIVL